MESTKKLNPHRIVTTAFGKKAKRSECRYIRSEFYKMDEECFNVNGKWYRINSGFLGKNIDTQKWELKENLVYGLVLDEDKVVPGYFNKDVIKNVPIKFADLPLNIKDLVVSGSTNILAHTELVPVKIGLEEELSSGVFTRKSKLNTIKGIKGDYDFPIDYSFEYSGGYVLDETIKYLNTTKPNINNNIIPHTFGFEFETTDGFIPPRVLVKTGLIPVRDGSISGYEYVTVPLEGNKGLACIKNAAQALTKYTTKSLLCSLHLHLGKLPISEAYLSKAYVVCTKLQDEIYSMFAPSLAATHTYKQRDYCNALKVIPQGAIPEIVDYVAGSKGYHANNYRGLGAKGHPADTENRRKWQVESRYVWANFVPYIFSKRHTIEFRIHTPTANPTKIINWLFICSAILKFAEDYDVMDTKPLILRQVLSVYPKDIADYLNSYIEYRKTMIKESVILGDTRGELEINSDYEFEFPFNGRKTLID